MSEVVGVDAAVARVAGRQYRVISTRQLRAIGMSRDAVRYRVDRGRMRRMWRGIYLVGPGQADTLSLAIGGVLSIEPDGVLSQGWGGWLWGFMPKPDFPIDVTHTGGSRAGPKPLRVHRTANLQATRRRGIPVTTPARTLLDLAEVVDADELAKLVGEAQVIGVVRERDIHAVIARNPNRHGAARLKAVFEDAPMLTRHESERRMFALLKAAGLPKPETGTRIGRYKPDFLYRDQRLIIEVDGFAAHGHRRAFESDRRREAELVAMGYRVMHVTWRQLRDEPMAVAARIAAALAYSSSSTAAAGEFARRTSASMPFAGSGREK